MMCTFRLLESLVRRSSLVLSSRSNYSTAPPRFSVLQIWVPAVNVVKCGKLDRLQTYCARSRTLLSRASSFIYTYFLWNTSQVCIGGPLSCHTCIVQPQKTLLQGRLDVAELRLLLCIDVAIIESPWIWLVSVAPRLPFRYSGKGYPADP